MQQNSNLAAKTLLGIGFFALAIGVAAAYTEPATGYELSIYTETPTLFWVGAGVATVVALSVSLFARTTAVKIVGLALGGGSFLAVFGLPLLRNYHYYGTGDAMTHLGWARAMMAGEKSFFSLLYPGIHTVSVFISEVTGYAMTRSMMIMVLVFALLFLIFVPLCVWALTRNLQASVVALFSAFMLLPITNISSQLVAHTTTQTLLFLPVAIYFLIRYLQSDPWKSVRPTTSGMVLGIALLAVLLYHPQQALNLLLVFVGIAVVQLVTRRYLYSGQRLGATPRTVYAQTGLFAVAFLSWSAVQEGVRESVENKLDEILLTFLGRPDVASQTAQRGQSLSQIGGSLLEIFLKIFTPLAVYSLIGGLVLLLAVLSRRDDEGPIRNSFNRYLAYALVPVAGIFVVYFVSSIGTQSFRHLGFLMVFVTILGAIGTERVWRGFSTRISHPAASSAVAIGLAVVLAVAVLSVFPSPWIFLHSQHVTEMEMTGHEQTFEHTDGDARLFGVREGPDRQADAYYGQQVPQERFAAMNESAMLSDLSEEYGQDWYFVLSEGDRQREVRAYDQFRYSRRSFGAAGTQQGVNNVIDNGEFDLYYVTG